jgi:thymidylate synthase (FAD)
MNTISDDWKTVHVLDHGTVTLLDHMGDDLTVINAARVSLGRHNETWDPDDRKLLRYLIENKHTSPFEHVIFQFYVKCPLFVRSQWHRSRTWSYNECSLRYTAFDDSYYTPEQFRKQSKSDRQASVDESIADASSADLVYRRAMEAAKIAYRKLLDAGVCREQARAVLPVGCYTSFYATVDLHNLLHFLRLRLSEHAQYEMRLYAQALRDLVTPFVPETMAIVFPKEDLTAGA